MFRKVFISFLVLGFLALLVGGGVVVWGYFYFTRDLPDFESTDDYRPDVVSYIYAADGSKVAEFFRERRYPLKLDEVPLFVQNAFLAAEDAAFFSHPGIDLVSVLRAMIKNFQTGSARQGGSTITQQVVKNILLTREKSLRRKIKEAILAYRLERRLSKKEILELYLNQIFFGNGAYGLKAAARAYFHKEIEALTVAEAALLAGLPKAPSRYSPLSDLNKAKGRQQYVLSQMVKAGFIERTVAQGAMDEELTFFHAEPSGISPAPYYVAEVKRILEQRWRDYNIEADGLQIYTALDLSAYDLAVKALRAGLREVDKRRGWRGPITHLGGGAEREEFLQRYPTAAETLPQPDEIYPALVLSVSPGAGEARVDLGGVQGVVSLKSAAWANRMLNAHDRVQWSKPERVLRAGDVIEVSLDASQPYPKNAGEPVKVVLDQLPDIEGATVLLEPYSGKVSTVVGGYVYGRSQFNRATQALRQPGSAFKPIVYLAAVDGFGYTPATIVHDEPRTFRVGNEFWTPGNFDSSFLGAITLRVALEKSRNLVSADIISRIGVDSVIRYAKRLGLESNLGRNLSISLGSSEVTLLELTRAYGVFAARGVLADSVFITRLVDRDGKVLFDYDEERLDFAKRVISEESAFIMANMMKGVVESGTGYVVKKIGRPVAGKTGTSNDLMDTWFIGYTPAWVCGVWVGFDQKKKIGEKETGGRVSAPIFLDFMGKFLQKQDQQNYERLVLEAKQEAERLGIDYQEPEPLAPLDFNVPEGVEPFWINKQGGYRSDSSDSGAILEYFKKGTEPPPAPQREAEDDYWQSPIM